MEEDSSKSKMKQTEKCSTKFVQTDNASSDAKTGDVKLVPKQNKELKNATIKATRFERKPKYKSHLLKRKKRGAR